MKEILIRLQKEWDSAESIEDFGQENIEELFKIAKYYEDHIDWMLTKPSRPKKQLE